MTNRPIYRIPVHPQPGFYETTAVLIENPPGSGEPGTYEAEHYEHQREMLFGTTDYLKERATNALLDAGRVPTHFGGLADPVQYAAYRKMMGKYPAAEVPGSLFDEILDEESTLAVRPESKNGRPVPSAPVKKKGAAKR